MLVTRYNFILNQAKYTKIFQLLIISSNDMNYLITILISVKITNTNPLILAF